ncbi:phosphotransferase [Saccharothrix deserti]|uniref:phosphotransferase n=1 Tax=Saccharothrix deserti TaxID=2593674 RepID=UPI00131B13F3|nr:phosphotransferase [Saccharothrix deserti]
MTLSTGSGRVFCKGITTGSPLARMHRSEITVSPFLPERLAPRLLWHVEADGWLLLAFEHVSGQHADLSPDSPDLPAVADAVEEISRVSAPPASIAQRSMPEQWARALKTEIESPPPPDAAPWSAANADLLVTWAARSPAHMGGSHLIHSDLNPANFLVSDRARVIDWAWWRTGAAWVDPAFLVIRLVADGHGPEQAEKWARQFDGFADAPPDAITAFAASVLRLWERRFAGTPATNAARRWARYRVA